MIVKEGVLNEIRYRVENGYQTTGNKDLACALSILNDILDK